MNSQHAYCHRFFRGAGLNSSQPAYYHGFLHGTFFGQPEAGYANARNLGTIEGLIPAKGDFCINGSQSF
jgi:hypothetical protein